MIRHILLIQIKQTAQDSDIDHVKMLFELIPQKVDGVTAVEWGVNESPEGLNKDFTH